MGWGGAGLCGRAGVREGRAVHGGKDATCTLGQQA
jgi:hypothetical protein